MYSTRIALLALTGVLSAARGSAQDAGLAEGGLSFRALAGYGESGYALPVANSALGRDWAMDSAYAWQLAYGQSTLPLHVRIEHRMPGAFRGRLEVECPDAYHPAEKGAGNSGLVSCEVVVPPSAPLDLYLPLRCAPLSQPGALVKAEVRLFAKGMQGPLIETEADAVQLEPAHAYSLLLDGAEGAISGDAINPRNRLRLRYPGQQGELTPLESFGVTSFNHYLISCQHRQMTALPTAATDFAFVCASLGAVRDWPAADQEALVAYVLAGGHLCLFDAGGEWLGLDFTAADAAPGFGRRQAGRGELLYLAGSLEAARRLMVQYLEGELSEFVLWQGGSVAGEGLGFDAQLRFRHRGGLAEAYLPGGGDKPGELPSRRSAYLNPVVAYRELCRQSALEPFDYPEFSLAASESTADSLLLAANPALAGIDRRLGGSLPPLLSNLAQPGLSRPVLPLAATGLMLLALLPGWRARCRPASQRRRPAALQSLRLGSASAALVLAGLAISGAGAPVLPELRLEMADRHSGVGAEARRELHLRSTQGSGSAELSAPAAGALRRSSGAPPGAWSWDWRPGAEPGNFQVRGGQYASASFSAWSPSTADDGRRGPGPVAVLHRLDAQRVELTVNTAALPGGRGCWLQDAFGLRYLPGSTDSVRVELDLPVWPPLPGTARLKALRLRRSHSGQAGLLEAQLMARSDAVQRLLAERPQDCGAPSPLERLVLGAALQQPGGRRGQLFLAPALYYFESAPADGTSCRLVRQTLDWREAR